MAKELKIDITSKVTATFRNDCLELKANQLYVGKIQLNNCENEMNIQLEEGYLFESGKVYKCISLREDSEKIEEKVLNERR